MIALRIMPTVTSRSLKIALPIDPLLPRILAAISAKNRILLIASPGSGKTTRVPWAVSEALRASGSDGKVYVLEPRRIAAKLSAERVAEENGVRVGEEIGYQFRFDRKRKDSTRLVFLTEGTLLREIQSNPNLFGIAALFLDEFHERHLQGDLALALAKKLQETTRPDLRIIVMSATLDSGPLERFLPGSEIIEVEAPRFPIEIEYAPLESKLEIEIRRKVAELLARADAEKFGDLLIFLPGMAEIRRVESELKALRGFELYTLHGENAREEQDRALAPSTRRKVILSTNIAESSVTIPGVNTVIDSGIARVASFSHSSGLPRLETKNISRASAVQRAGRAGRTSAGRVVRLYSKGDYEGRPSQETPEILRADLAPVLLDLASLGLVRAGEMGFEFFERPSDERMLSGWQLLKALGFTDEGELSPWGKLAAESAFHPRITRALLEALRLGVGKQAIPALLAVSEGVDLGVDFMEGLRRFRIEGFQAKISDRMEQALSRFQTQLPELNAKTAPVNGDLLSRVVLAGFHDRVGKRKDSELLLARGGSAAVSGDPYWQHSHFHLVLDMQETKRAGDLRSKVSARSAIAVEEEWLWEIEPMPLMETTERVFDERRKKWVEYDCLSFHSLLLSRTLRPEKNQDVPPSGELSEEEWQSLFQAWLAELRKDLAERDTGVSPRVPGRTDAEAWTSLKVRYALLRETYGSVAGLEAEAYSAGDFQALLRFLLFSSYREVRSSRDFPTLEILLSGLWDSGAFRKFTDEVPAVVSLPGRKRVFVYYEEGTPVRIESRMQEFFGLAEGPKILGGTKKLSLHLLAPNFRAVQMTEDLRGFWERHYPSIRKELMRSYPKHAWPENPLTATPPPERPPRRF